MLTVMSLVFAHTIQIREGRMMRRERERERSMEQFDDMDVSWILVSKPDDMVANMAKTTLSGIRVIKNRLTM